MCRDRRARVCPTEWPGRRDSRGSSMHAGTKRMATWMARWRGREDEEVEEKRGSACRRPSSSRSFVCSRCGGKIRWGWRLDLLASPSVGPPLSTIISWRLTAVNSKLFAGHSGILIRRPSSSSPSAIFSSIILSNPPSSSRPPSTKDRPNPHQASEHESHPDRDRHGTVTRAK